jgi:hypothetical protein
VAGCHLRAPKLDSPGFGRRLTRALLDLGGGPVGTESSAVEQYSLFGHRLQHLASLHRRFEHHLIRQILTLLARSRNASLREELGTDTSIRNFLNI